ncbi:MAG TPA: hypothetical protein VG844_10860 [Terracidiphilus sp.]|nr:hypothetical protein [Terracidiphilus sp.]
MNKLKYVGLIIGTIIGLAIAAPSVPNGFRELLPVPLGLICFGIGALFSRDGGTTQNNG